MTGTKLAEANRSYVLRKIKRNVYNTLYLGIISKLTISIQPNSTHNVGIWITALNNFMIKLNNIC